MLAERFLHDVGFHGTTCVTGRTHAWARALLSFVHRQSCAIRGHDLLFRFEPRRLSLRCVHCGWESSGWVIDRPQFSDTTNRAVHHARWTASSAASWSRPFEASTPVFRSTRRPLVKSSGWPARSVTRPPASSINSDPAA